MSDFDEIEKTFVRQIGPVPACLPLAMLRAHAESVLPSDADARVGAHLAKCKLCRMLLKDLRSLDNQPFTAASRDRVHSIIPIPPQKSSATPWYAISAIAAGLAIITFLLTTTTNHLPPTLQIATTQAPQPIHQSNLPRSLLKITKLPPPQSAVSAIVFRGAVSASEPDAAELAAAFVAYNNNNYPLAAARFSTLAARFPKSDIPVLYLGVIQLLTENKSAALATLAHADAIARPSRKDAASWYHAAAALLAQSADAPALLRSVCNRGKSPFTQQACSLSQASELDQAHQTPLSLNPAR